MLEMLSCDKGLDLHVCVHDRHIRKLCEIFQILWLCEAKFTKLPYTQPCVLKSISYNTVNLGNDTRF